MAYLSTTTVSTTNYNTEIEQKISHLVQTFLKEHQRAMMVNVS